MQRKINKVAVLGSGIMGSRIACLFANIGLEVLLLDLPFIKSKEDSDKKNTTKQHSIRNKIVEESLKKAIKSSSLFHSSFLNRIELGNFEDDLHKVKHSDWIIEVVVENLEIKKQIFEKIEEFRKLGTIITTNTSGIPINKMLEGRSEDFKKCFCGTHFFNPPRYLKLLEIIPSRYTNQEIVDFLMNYGDYYLGKTTVLAKDTPAFIANRVGIFGMLKMMDSMQKFNFSIDEIDQLTGSIIGRPKSATFRTSDIVGLDTLTKVAKGLYENLLDDESREMFKIPDFISKMSEKNWLGEKTNQGFYKKTKNVSGETQILHLDINSFEYKPRNQKKLPSLEHLKTINNFKDRFKTALSIKGNVGKFYQESFYSFFQYVSNRIPEIADELYKIDEALCAGFGWQYGPFELWDFSGFEQTLNEMKKVGYEPNSWVIEMSEKGYKSFYKNENGITHYYDVRSKSYLPITRKDTLIILDNIRERKTVWNNSGSTIFDLGDGILNLEFNTKMNILGSDVIEGLNKAIDLAEQNFNGLVIGNQGVQFSAGANLAIIYMHAIDQEFDEIDIMVRHFQNAMMRVKYSDTPIVVAPHGLTLGGGCEMTMHADIVQASAETYIGLVEAGVGLIPAGGGTKELVKRVSDDIEKGDVVYNSLQNSFMNIATAKVATSAYEAVSMRLMRSQDGISINNDRLIVDAKQTTLKLVNSKYVKPIQSKMIEVQGKTGMALFMAGINGMRVGNYISDHDVKIANKIAYVMCGGDLSYPQNVTEQYLLDLEREAFLSLTGERKTLERIHHTLTTGKPLRN